MRPRGRAARRAANDDAASASGARAFACECADDGGCEATVDLEPHEYLAVRDHPGRFLVAPGHERDGHDMVVELHDGYRVVERPPCELFLG